MSNLTDLLFGEIDIIVIDVFRGLVQVLQSIDQDLKAGNQIQQQRLQVETQILQTLRAGQLPATRLAFHLGTPQKQ